MLISKKYLIVAMSAAMGVNTVAFAAEGDTEQAAEQLHFSNTIKLSDRLATGQTEDLGMAFKAKLVMLGNGALVSVYGDGVDSTKVVYDLKGDENRPARDIFIRTCDSVNTDCALEENWSDPENVSLTATETSINTNWTGDTDGSAARTPYYGDSDKPNISNGGSNIMITWTDKFCGALPGDVDGTNQRTVTYVTRENREIPFSCTYARYASVSGGGAITWRPGSETGGIQLSDGSRDAKQDVSKVNSIGRSIITWQEDPQGLRIGSADGPGDGASGATANHGTDIWMTTSTNTVTSTDPDTGKPSAGYVSGLNSIARLTNNATNNLSGGHHAVKDVNGAEVDGATIDSGQTAATRANTALVGSTAVVTYEETKGSEEIEIGKYIRYHSFAYPADDAALTTASGQVGCVISNPAENARRVRFVPQATPGEVSGVQIGIFWKEGKYDQGGPSDIMARLVKGTGFADMEPAVDANCEAATYEAAVALQNEPALNLSSNTKTGGNLTDTTETNNIENALAHRGAIVGDDLYIGYSYTSDWALTTYTTLDNYDFWLRHYDGVTDTWSAPKNLSNLPDTSMNVREPRFVKTPYSEDGTYNPDAFVIAWGTQTNVASHIEDPEELDIYYTRSFDKGATFEPIVKVDNPNGAARFESQLRPTPDGRTVYAVWNEDDNGAVDAVHAVAISGEATGEDPYDTGVETSSSGGSASVLDGVLLPSLLAALMGMIGFFGARRAQK